MPRCASPGRRCCALLDSDDLWEPTFLAEQLAILEARPEIDIVTGNGRLLGGVKHGQLARPYPDARPDPTLASIIADERSVFIMSVFRRTRVPGARWIRRDDAHQRGL